jgi:hypothetical protein
MEPHFAAAATTEYNILKPVIAKLIRRRPRNQGEGRR